MDSGGINRKSETNKKIFDRYRISNNRWTSIWGSDPNPIDTWEGIFNGSDNRNISSTEQKFTVIFENKRTLFDYIREWK